MCFNAFKTRGRPSSPRSFSPSSRLTSAVRELRSVAIHADDLASKPVWCRLRLVSGSSLAIILARCGKVGSCNHASRKQTLRRGWIASQHL
eukprot:3661663-Rhodomonas_salina.1